MYAKTSPNKGAAYRSSTSWCSAGCQSFSRQPRRPRIKINRKKSCFYLVICLLISTFAPAFAETVPWMSGLVNGLQNRLRRFESARHLPTAGSSQQRASRCFFLRLAVLNRGRLVALFDVCLSSCQFFQTFAFKMFTHTPRGGKIWHFNLIYVN